MNTTELHNAVTASPGPLEDELMARIWCAVNGREFLGVNRDYKNQLQVSWRRLTLVGFDTLSPRPDISTDAALELVRVKFPNFEYEISGATKETLMVLWPPETTKITRALGNGKHKDRRLAIIAALLKAMGA